jgi:hypothetical protein
MGRKVRLWIRWAAGLAGVIAVIVLAPTGVASATSVVDARPVGQVVERPMTVVGFHHPTAEANGYEIRTRPDGREYSVKKTAGPQHTDVTPFNEVTGNCGSSWLYIYGHKGEADVQTGFRVRLPITAYVWTVSVRNTRGESDFDWAGGIQGKNLWQGRKLVDDLPRGDTVALVIQPSTAVLTDGAVCISDGPWDDTYVS